jgi:Rrf2 family transcriptional regulator, iron-sulfur cluster assembly transcription factor
MIRYGKSTQNAIAAMSRLSEAYHGGLRLSSHDIAESRDLSRTLIAKLLTQLSQARLVSGTTGPGGGYTLARPPTEISLYDIAAVFERVADKLACPFGPNWCGTGKRCPMHDKFTKLDDDFEHFLKTATLDIFNPS